MRQPIEGVAFTGANHSEARASTEGDLASWTMTDSPASRAEASPAPEAPGSFSGDALLAPAVRTLQQATARWDRRRASEDEALDTFLWQRAARAAWLIGNPAQYGLWYARAADELLDVALGMGSTTGTYAYYAEMALGAASLAAAAGTHAGLLARVSLLTRVADVVRSHPTPAPAQRRRGRWAHVAESHQVGHEALRAWAAWCAGDARETAALLLSASRKVQTLGPQAGGRWRESHWPDLLAALGGLVDARPPAVRDALLSMDAKLARRAGDMPILSLTVHETLAAMAVEWRKLSPRTFQPEGFTLAVMPGGADSQSSLLGELEGAPDGENTTGEDANGEPERPYARSVGLGPI